MGDAVISFVCWKWRGPDPMRQFLAHHVNVLAAMVRRHYQQPHRFICITDDPEGLDGSIEAFPMPEHSFDQLQSPNGPRFPSCYRRLWVFSHAAVVLGETIFCLDIDSVVFRDLAPLVHRGENFVGWCDERFLTPKIAGGAYLLRTGTMTHVWDDFRPHKSPALALEHGFGGSDQGWMGYRMYPPPGAWKREDGLVKIGWTPAWSRTVPAGARIAFTSGVTPPWHPETQRRYPWVKDHWKL
jgi:hypothetical protein